MKYKKRIFLGYDDSGKRIQKRIYADSKKELADIEHELKNSGKRSRINFKTFSDEWLRVYKANNSNATVTAYKRILRLQCLPLHGLPLGSITRTDCQSILNECKPPTAKKVATTLNQIFNSAILDGYIDKNPMFGVVTPKLAPVTRRALTEEEKERISTAELADMDKLYLNCLLYFGLRPGEASALTAEDFDLKKDTLTVSKAFEFPSNQPILKDTKTGSIRVLPIPSNFDKSLLPSEGYLFQHDGKPLSRTVFRRMFSRIKKQIGDEDLHPYIFRYNYATNLYYSGITLKKASYLMGHSDTNMILKIYAQLQDEQENISALKNMDFLSGEKVVKVVKNGE